MGHPGTRTAEMAPGPNNFTNYGWGSAYDPHRPGSLAQTPAPGETGAIPIFPFWFPPYTGAPIGVPPPDIDR